MKIIFHLGHPAHFHLFKNVIKQLECLGHKPFILIKKKDILEDLLIESKIRYHNILPSGRKSSRVGLFLGIVKQTMRLFIFCIKNKPDILVGSTTAIAHVGKIINKPSINLSEDDANAVKLFSQITFPFSTVILSPVSCDNGNWNNKTIKYNSYHELAYLHPDHFTPCDNIVEKYTSTHNPYFLLRFSGLSAYHDKGVDGINNKVALKIIDKLIARGTVIISSEKPLMPELEKYRLQINPLDIHHLIALAEMFIGDSQTMAAESAVLGTPFIRINDFVGRLGYLNELENKYRLGIGIKPKDFANIFGAIDKYLLLKNRKTVWNARKQRMLEDKMDFSVYLTSYIMQWKYSNGN